MKFPKFAARSYFVGSELYRLVYCTRLKDYGETDLEKCVIRVKSSLSPRECFSTTVHEFLHAVDEEFGIGLKHEQIYKLEKALVNFYMDNFYE